MTKCEREEMESLRWDLGRAKEMEQRYHVYTVAVDEAIEGLMRDVLAHVIDPLSHPNSINSGNLIAAVAKASERIHRGR